MNLISNIDFIDFYFNGHFLSEYGGFIGGTENLSQYPLLPSRVYTTDRVIGQDGVTVFDSYLEPRMFEIPIFFEEIDYAGIRKIASWLNTATDEWFYFKGDTLKIKCTLDSNGTDLESLAGADGGVSLKFIAHDPYYYELVSTEYTYANLTGTTNTYNLNNDGGANALPFLSIWGDGTITVNVYKESKSNLYTTCVVTGLVTGVELNTKYRTCLTQSGAQMFNNFNGQFPMLPTGNYILEILGNINKLTLKPNYRYV